MTISESIPERDLPVAAPAAVDHVRGVTAGGKSMLFKIGGEDGLATNQELSAAIVELNSTVSCAIEEVSEAAAKMLSSSTSPKFRSYGGQIAALAQALTDPLHQAVYVTFIGDSITWGATLPDNAPTDPRDGTLADPRDNYVSASYVNEFKRYVGREYFDGVAPVLSNWSYSSSGQSTAAFSKKIDLYPGIGPFTVTSSGASVSLSEPVDAAYLLGKALRLDVAASASYYAIDIPHFTGDSLSVVYTSVAGLMQQYELYVDGVLKGTFDTENGTTYGNVRNHAFAYVRDKTVQIRSKYPSGGSGTKRLMIEAIRVPKVCRITNQGVNGTEFRRYSDWMFGAFGPSVTSASDEFYFVQLGSNNRGSVESPFSVNRLSALAVTLIDKLVAVSGRVILMAANPATPDAPTAPFKYRMSDVRNSLNDVARSKSLDFIDNYAVFQGVSSAEFTADGLHPNKFGHAMIVKNIIGALEMS